MPKNEHAAPKLPPLLRLIASLCNEGKVSRWQGALPQNNVLQPCFDEYQDDVFRGDVCLEVLVHAVPRRKRKS